MLWVCLLYLIACSFGLFDIVMLYIYGSCLHYFRCLIFISLLLLLPHLCQYNLTIIIILKPDLRNLLTLTVSIKDNCSCFPFVPFIDRAFVFLRLKKNFLFFNLPFECRYLFYYVLFYIYMKIECLINMAIG